MSSSNPSRASTVKVFSASVLAAATVAGFVAYFNGDTYQAGTQEVTTASGSTVTAGGGTFQATNLANAACRKDTLGRYYDCYQVAQLTNTGACVGPCSDKSYHVASITKPFTGSGTIRRIEVSCDHVGVSSTLYASQVATSSTASGNNILTKKTIGSGASIVSSTGSNVWAEATPDLRVFAGTRLGVNSSKCIVSVVSDEMYNP